MLSRCFNLKLLVTCVAVCMFTEANYAGAEGANNDFTEYFKPVAKKTTKKGKRKGKGSKQDVSMKSKDLINQAKGSKYVDANFANDTGTCIYAQTNNINALNAELEKAHFASNVVNRKCSNGESLLLIATKNDNFIAFKTLLEHGANPNLENSAAIEFGNVEAVRGLMKAGANTTMKNNYGQNSIALAEQMVVAQRNPEKAVVNKQILDIVNRAS